MTLVSTICLVLLGVFCLLPLLILGLLLWFIRIIIPRRRTRGKGKTEKGFPEERGKTDVVDTEFREIQ